MSSLPGDQHMARVSVPKELWLEFRALAVIKKRSVADYLGHLVQRELSRAAAVNERREWRERLAKPESLSDEIDEGSIPPWET